MPACVIAISLWRGDQRRPWLTLDRCGGHARTEGARCALVRLGPPRAVDLQGRDASTAVAEPARDSSYVHTRGDQLGRRVVPELMKVHIPAEAGTHAFVPLAECVRLDPDVPSGTGSAGRHQP